MPITNQIVTNPFFQLKDFDHTRIYSKSWSKKVEKGLEIRKFAPTEILDLNNSPNENMIFICFCLEFIYVFVGYIIFVRRNVRRKCVCSPECANIFLYVFEKFI